MSCYNPLTAYVVGINKSTGKKIISFKENPSIRSLKDFEVLQIPCGKCIGCRLDYSRHWADRCMLENQYHKYSWFLTLTFDDDHLPPKKEGSQINSIRKSDVQNFMKQLRIKVFERYVSKNPIASLYYDKKKGSNWRKRFENDYPNEYIDFEKNIPRIRFFACGEYGSADNSFRPHYHLLLFGLQLDDVELIQFDRTRGIMRFTSNFISDIWNNGFHILEDVTWNSCAYVARYVVKKQKGKGSEIYKKLNYEPEFVLMSRKPGIGYQYFKDHPDIIENPKYIGSAYGSKRITSNKYFDYLWQKEFDSDLDKIYYENIKNKRKLSMDNNINLKLEQTSLSYSQQLKVEENKKLESIKALKRKEV